MTNRSGRMGRQCAAGLLALALMAGISGACVERTGRDEIVVHNATGVPLTFTCIVPGLGTSPSFDLDIPGITGPGERSLVLADNLVRGEGGAGENGCTTGTLIARELDGTEVARHGPGLCDTADWEVTRAAPSASP